MAKYTSGMICVFGFIVIIASVYGSVTYRVIKSQADGTQAAIDINEQSLYWSLVLRFNNTVRLRMVSGGTIMSSSPEGNIYIIGGNPIGPKQTLSVVFESKYNRKPGAKLISATFNGRPVRVL